MEKEANRNCGKKSIDKGEIRRQILAARDRMEPEVKARCDEAIRVRVFAHPAYKESQVILAYASYRSEVDTAVMIRQALADGKYVFTPKVAGTEMDFWQVTSLEDLHEGYKGILEPDERISFPNWIERAIGVQRRLQYKAMMWMPGAVFDRKRHRIGYGKGFYDRYLGRFYGYDREERIAGGQTEVLLTTAALAYTCQLVQDLPCEPHDVRPDIVITEAEIL